MDWIELVPRREIFWQVASIYNTPRANGGFFFFVPLPNNVSSHDIVPYWRQRYDILVFPGHFFGMPNYVRVSYGSLSLDDTKEAANRLKIALNNLWNNC